MSVPYWVKDAVFYQIFPDRFANGDRGNDPVNVQAWGSPPTNWGFQGGDLRGIIQHFDYLLDLGINAIYLNPIFQSTSNHRYNCTDYHRIDPKLGTLHDFHALLDLAHSNHVRLILDGVFNHCGRGFFAFNDVLENQEHSPYKDWFHINHFPVHAYDNPQATDYEAWWRFSSLPKFNVQNPAVREYLLGVARYWIEQGADGWRLDVPNEINDDTFWAEFRHVVKTANRDAYLVGEIWDGDPRWVGSDHFDGLIHYPFRKSLIDFISGKIHASDFGRQIEGFMNLYPHDNAFAMYLPLGTHDTERIWQVLDGDLGKIKLAFLLLLTMPGVPGIYYGDEVGISGGKDPDCRRAFPWNRDLWKPDLHDWVKQLTGLRKRHTALRRGIFHLVAANDDAKYVAFSRKLNDGNLLIVLNIGDVHQSIQLHVADLWQDGRIVRNHLGVQEFIVSGDIIDLKLDAKQGMVIG